MSPESEGNLSERVKKIVVPRFEHTEAGVRLELKQMAIYLLNEDDFGISPEEFRPDRHEHAIPKYEMARIYLLVCATTGDDLGFTPEDRDDPVFHIYEKAYQRCLLLEHDPQTRARLDLLARQNGFHAQAEGHLHASP